MLVDTCSVTDTSITGYRDIGGIAGYLQSNSSVKNSNITNVTINVDKSHNYKNYSSPNEFDANSIVGESKGTIADCTGVATINF